MYLSNEFLTNAGDAGRSTLDGCDQITKTTPCRSVCEDSTPLEFEEETALYGNGHYYLEDDECEVFVPKTLANTFGGAAPSHVYEKALKTQKHSYFATPFDRRCSKYYTLNVNGGQQLFELDKRTKESILLFSDCKSTYVYKAEYWEYSDLFTLKAFDALLDLSGGLNFASSVITDNSTAGIRTEVYATSRRWRALAFYHLGIPYERDHLPSSHFVVDGYHHSVYHGSSRVCVVKRLSADQYVLTFFNHELHFFVDSIKKVDLYEISVKAKSAEVRKLASLGKMQFSRTLMSKSYAQRVEFIFSFLLKGEPVNLFQSAPKSKMTRQQWKRIQQAKAKRLEKAQTLDRRPQLELELEGPCKKVKISPPSIITRHFEDEENYTEVTLPMNFFSSQPTISEDIYDTVLSDSHYFLTPLTVHYSVGGQEEFLGQFQSSCATVPRSHNTEVKNMNTHIILPMGHYDDGEYVRGTHYCTPETYPEVGPEHPWKTKGDFLQEYVRLQMLIAAKQWTWRSRKQAAEAYKVCIEENKFFKQELCFSDLRIIRGINKFIPYARPKFRALLTKMHNYRLGRFQGIMSSLVEKFSLLDTMTDIASIVSQIGKLISTVREKFHSVFIDRLGVTPGPLVTKILDAVLLFICVGVFACVVKLSYNFVMAILGAIADLFAAFFGFFDPRKIFSFAKRTYHYYTDEAHEFQTISSKSHLLGMFLTATVFFVSAGTVHLGKKDGLDCIRNIGPVAGVVQTIFDNFENIVHWILSKIWPDCPWMGDMAIQAEYELIRLRLGQRKGLGDFRKSLSQEPKMRAEIRADADYMHRNVGKLLATAKDVNGTALVMSDYNCIHEHLATVKEVEAAAVPRKQPICIVLYGKPGVGKSQLVSVIARTIVEGMQARGVEGWSGYNDPSNYVWAFNRSDAYASGYAHQPICLLDDWAQTTNEEELHRETMAVIDFVNVVPKALTMAALADKGCVYFDSPIVIISTNLTNYQNLPVTDLGAIGRRFTYVLDVDRGETIGEDAVVTKEVVDKAWLLMELGFSCKPENVASVGCIFDQFWTRRNLPRPILTSGTVQKSYIWEQKIKLETVLRACAKLLVDNSTKQSISDRLVVEDFNLFQGSKISLQKEEQPPPVDEGKFKDKREPVSVLTFDEWFDFFEKESGISNKLPGFYDVPLGSVRNAVFPFVPSSRYSPKSIALVQKSVLNPLVTMDYFGLYDLEYERITPFEGNTHAAGKHLGKVYDVFNTICRFQTRAYQEYIRDMTMTQDSLVKVAYKPEQANEWKSFLDGVVKDKAIRDITGESYNAEDIGCVDRLLPMIHSSQEPVLYLMALLLTFNGSMNVRHLIYEYMQLVDKDPFRQHSISWYNCRGGIEAYEYDVGMKFHEVYDYCTASRKAKNATGIIYEHTGWLSRRNETTRYIDTDFYQFCCNSLKRVAADFPLRYRVDVGVQKHLGISSATLSCIGAVLAATSVLVGVCVGVGTTCTKVDGDFQISSSESDKVREKTEKEYSGHQRARELSKRGEPLMRDSKGRIHYAPGGNFNSGSFQSAAFEARKRDMVVARNQWTAVFEFGDGTATMSQLLFYDSRQAGFNRHVYYDRSKTLMSVSLYPGDPGDGVQLCHKIPKSLFTIHEPERSRDLLYLHFNKVVVSGIRNLWKMVAPRAERKTVLYNVERVVTGSAKGKEVVIFEGPYKQAVLKTESSSQFVVYSEDGAEYRDTGLDYYEIAGGKAYRGDCGDGYVSQTEAYPLLGQHFASIGGSACMVPVYREDQLSDEDVPDDDAFVPGAEELIDFQSDVPEIKGAQPIGKWIGGEATSPPFTKYYVQNQTLKEGLPENAYKVRPILGKKPMENRNKMTMNFGTLNVYFHDRAMEASDWFDVFLGQGKHTQFKMQTFEQAVFGDATVEPKIVSMATSSKFTGPFFRDVDKSMLVNFMTKEYNPILKERVMSYFKMALEGKPVRPIVDQLSKDELLAREKVYKADPECRIINGHDLAYNIFLKMICGGVVQFACDHWERGMTALGIDCLSAEWSRMVGQMMTGDGGVMTGDIGKQEATMNRFFYNCIVKYFSELIVPDPILVPDYDCGDTWTQFLMCALAGLDGYYFIANGYVYFTTRGHSSGHYLTTFYNTFCVFIIHKVAFEKLVPGKKFEDYVRGRFTGDDSLLKNQSRVINELYNMNTISKFCKEAWGIKYTSASDKEGEVAKFADTHFFLGRTLAVRDHGGHKFVVGMLRPEAIWDMVIYNKRVAGMDEADLRYIRMKQAAKEAVIHGPNFYREFEKRVRSSCAAEEQNIPPGVLRSYKTWADEIYGPSWWKNDVSKGAKLAQEEEALRKAGLLA